MSQGLIDISKPISYGTDTKTGQRIAILPRIWGDGGDRVRVRDVRRNGYFGPVRVISSERISD